MAAGYLGQKDDDEYGGGDADEPGAEADVVPLLAVDRGHQGVRDAPRQPRRQRHHAPRAEQHALSE